MKGKCVQGGFSEGTPMPLWFALKGGLMAVQKIDTNVEAIVALRNSKDAKEMLNAAQERAAKGSNAPGSSDDPAKSALNQLEDRVTFSPDARNRAVLGQVPSTSEPDALRAYGEAEDGVRMEMLDRIIEKETDDLS